MLKKERQKEKEKNTKKHTLKLTITKKNEIGLSIGE